MRVPTALTFLGSVALSSAQFAYQGGNGTYTCKTKGIAAYCAGGSIIIRCNHGVGNAGNCNDNLANYPPVGINGLAGCYQSSKFDGDAACTKAGLVYPVAGSGASDADPFPVPGSISGTNSSSAPAVLATPRISMGTGIPSAINAVQTVTVTATKLVVTDCGDGTTIYGTAQNTPVAPSAPISYVHNYNASTVTVAPLPANTSMPLAPGPQIVPTTILFTAEAIATAATTSTVPYAMSPYTISPPAVTSSMSTSASPSASATYTEAAAFTGAASRFGFSVEAIGLCAMAAFAVL